MVASRLVVAPVALLVIMAWNMRWMSDDGFIHLRVADQLLHGNGPVFNAGERVEASTSPLWVFLLAATRLAAPLLSLEWIAVLSGIARYASAHADLGDLELTREVAAARHAVVCGDLARLLEAVSVAPDAERLITNVRESATLTRLRYGADPRCGRAGALSPVA